MTMPDRDRDDRTRLDLHPTDTPPPPAPVVEDSVVDPDRRRIRAVSVACTVVTVICALFAVVLAVHIILVLGEANPKNGFASIVEDWSAMVALGLRGLFVPDSAKLQVLLNDGAAALLWLAIGAVLTYLIRRFALPGPRRVRYRRVVR